MPLISSLLHNRFFVKQANTTGCSKSVSKKKTEPIPQIQSLVSSKIKATIIYELRLQFIPVNTNLASLKTTPRLTSTEGLCITNTFSSGDSFYLKAEAKPLFYAFIPQKKSLVSSKIKTTIIYELRLQFIPVNTNLDSLKTTPRLTSTEGLCILKAEAKPLFYAFNYRPNSMYTNPFSSGYR